MEIEGNTAASVQDAFLKKDAVVDEKLNNATETTSTSVASIDIIKKSEADCSSGLETSSLDKITVEKDDLLDQIEEVCNDKISDLKSCEEISETSECEFLKKIEEMEMNESQAVVVGDGKAQYVAEELKAKNIIECEASTIDDVVVGDKILLVKEDDAKEPCYQLAPATSTEDATESKLVAKKVDEEKCESTTDVEMSNNEAMVSSSTAKLGKDVITTEAIVQKEVPVVEKVESTDTNRGTIEEEKVDDLAQSKNSSLGDQVADKMEVDNNDAVKEAMEVDVKDSLSDNSVEMATITTDNEAKSKADATVKNIEAMDQDNVDTKETTSTKSTEQSLSSQNCTYQLKHHNSENKEVKEESDLSLANHNDEKRTAATPIVEEQKPEHKSLQDLKLKENIVSSSLTNTPVSSSNVFNSTPIQKQFEISSENVSKISDAAELSQAEKDEDAAPTKPPIKSFDDATTESETCPTTETDQPSTDGTVKKYIDAIKKYNGMPDTTTDEEDTTTPAKTQKVNEKFEIKICHLSGADLKKDSTYEVTVCCEQDDVRYLSIERVDLLRTKNQCQPEKALTTESSVQSSSNGSVTSLPIYSLPQIVETTPTSASTSCSTNCYSLTTPQNKHTIVGIEELCNFMINQFTTIKHAVNPESVKAAATIEDSMLTPTQQIKKNKKNSPSVETPSTSVSKTKRARKRSHQEDDFEGTPKAKQSKRDISKDTGKEDDAQDNEETKTGPCVLAKWVDKKFYAGKITSEKPSNKYVVLFEDGASKTLPRESIVFGEGDTLPLQDQQVYALVEEDYESGTVLSIEKSSNKVLYTVKTENTTVKVTASDIYLEVDQAKEIQKLQNIKVGDGVEEEESSGTRPSRNKRPPASPSTPEAGYSGAAGKRGGKRQKRYS